MDEGFSFAIPLASPIAESNIHFIPKGEEGIVDPTECPGTLEKPEAEEGNVCVYEQTPLGSSEAVEFFGIESTFTSGFIAIFFVKEERVAGQEDLGEEGAGSWAVTAPSS